MPAISPKQREAAAIAEHSPGKLFKRNKGLLQMSQNQLHDFAATPEMPPQDTSPLKKQQQKKKSGLGPSFTL